jgi:hypothetical protein
MPISVKDGVPAQSFTRLCSTNFPSGKAWGNPGIDDIIKLYLPTLEDCIAACAMYNLNYQSNLGQGLGSSAGYCRAVTIVKSGTFHAFTSVRRRVCAMRTWELT